MRSLPGHQIAHFLLAFFPLTGAGNNCPSTRAATVWTYFGPLAGAHTTIRGYSKERQPIAPCPHTGFNVSPVAPGL
jgi:hypothetical protein